MFSFPRKESYLKSSGPNNLLPSSKKQRRATSQGKNSRKKSIMKSGCNSNNDLIPSKAKPITALPSASNHNGKATWKMVTKGSDGGKKGSKQKAIDDSYHAPPGNTIVMDIPPPPPPPPGLEPPAALDGISEEMHHGSNTIVFVQCSAASTLSIDDIYHAPPGNTIIMDIPLPPPPGLEPALQQDTTSCSDNVSTAGRIFGH
jgi:hypothetical protein